MKPRRNLPRALVIAGGIVVSTFSITNLFIMAGPGIYQATADDGVLFRGAATLHPRFCTPHPALAFQAGWAALLTLSGTYAQLLDYVTFGDWIFFGLVALMLFSHRRGWGRAAAAPTSARTPATTSAAGTAGSPGRRCASTATRAVRTSRSRSTSVRCQAPRPPC